MHNVTLFYVHSNTTDELEPMDKSFTAHKIQAPYVQSYPRRSIGGSANRVYRSIAHCQLPSPATLRLEVMSVALCLGAREVRLISAYLLPVLGGPPPQEEWDALSLIHI